MWKRLTGVWLAVSLLLILTACGNAGETGSGRSEAAGEALGMENASDVSGLSAAETPDSSAGAASSAGSAASAGTSASETSASKNTKSVPETSGAGGDEVLLYLILPSETGLSAQEEAIVLSGAKTAGYKVTVKIHNGDEAVQEKAFEEAIANGAAAVICDNVDTDSTLSCVQKAKNAGIPSFLINKGIASTGIAAAQIITDRYSCISRLAQVFAEHQNKECKYAMMTDDEDEDCSDAAAIFKEQMAAFSGMQLVVTEDTGSGADAGETAKRLLSDHPQLQAIVCVNSSQAEAAAGILQEESNTGVTVICLDGNDDAVSTQVLSGAIYAAVVKPAQKLAKQAITAVTDYFSRGTVGENEFQYITGIVLTTDGRENDSIAEGENSSALSAGSENAADAGNTEPSATDDSAEEGTEGLNPEGEEGRPGMNG